MRRADVIRARMAEIRTGLDEVEKIDEPTDEDATRSDDLLAEWDELAEELKPLEERETRLKAVAERSLPLGANREAGSHFGGELVQRTASDPYRNLDLGALRSGAIPVADVRARALSVLERDAKFELEHDSAEHVTRMIGRESRQRAGQYSVGEDEVPGGLAAHVLLTGSKEYEDAFYGYLRRPGNVQRAAMSLTPANGGYLVPYTLDPSIILTNNSSANPFRRLAEGKTTSTNDWNGVTSAGVNAAWLAEGTEAADSSPTVGTLKITPQKAAAWLFGSYEVLEDSDFASQFGMLMGDAKDRLEEQAFAAGAGTGGVPKGILTAATVAGVTTAASTAVSAANVFTLEGALPARWRGPRARLAFVGNLAQIQALRGMVAFAGSTQALMSSTGATALDPTAAGYIDGIPAYESTSFPSTLATTGAKPLIIGDWSQFYIVDRLGMSVMYEPMVKGAAGRPTGQGGWFAFWRVGSDVSTAQAFRTAVIG